MFKKFLITVCGSFVGSFIAILVSMFFMMMLGVAIAAGFGNIKTNVQNHSILVLDLSGAITERPTGAGKIDEVRYIFGEEPGISLQEIERALDVAMLEKKIDGVVINCQGVEAAPATLRAIRKAVKKFKSSKKWVYAYGNAGYSQGDYYVATAADSLFINPVGAVDVHGFASCTPYMKKMLDNIGINMQVVRVGAYKSAVEPYMIESMSEENREQQQHYMGQIWGVMEAEMAAARKINLATFDSYVNGVLVEESVDTLLKRRLVDAKKYRTEFEDMLRGLTDVEKTDDLNYITPQELAKNFDEGEDTDGTIAVLYACGEIDGAMNSSGIYSEDMVDLIRELQQDDDVKGLVLRVNSPGGSAFGSEQIWYALEQFKKSGKTFTVSMGDYAASGGYYISCGAHQIFADSTTITGSIGIFGMIPCAQDLMENKIGINLEVVKTNENADFLAMGLMSKQLTPVQLQALQNTVNQGYELFTKRCADGRKISQDSIKAIGGGRVWDGITAKKIGLVDQFGNLNDAIAWTAKKAGLHTGFYRVKCYPEPEDNFAAILDAYAQTRTSEQMKKEMGVFYTYYEQAQAILRRSHVLCLLPESELK